MRVRIRNHLVAKYFPELDRYYDQSSSTSLAIVRWCLDPSVIAGLEYKQFVRRVGSGQSGYRKRDGCRPFGRWRWIRSDVRLGRWWSLRRE